MCLEKLEIRGYEIGIYLNAFNWFKPRQGLDEIITFSCPSGGCQEPRSQARSASDMFRFTVTAVTPWCWDLNSEVLRRHRSTWPKHVTSMTWTPEPLRQKDANSKHIHGICIDIFIHIYVYMYICIYIYMSNYMAYTLCTHDVKSQNTDVSCNTIKHSLRSEIRAAS